MAAMANNPYFINSNSPSGGTKLMLLSLSNLPSLTHWWNWQSSISTALARRALYIHCQSRFLFNMRNSTYVVRLTVSLSSSSLSFKPNLHSGVPDRYALIKIWPATSALRMVPVLLINRLTLSMTSMKASFFLYLMSFLLQEIAPVACMVILLESSAALSDFTPSVVMYILSVSVSLFWG